MMKKIFLLPIALFCVSTASAQAVSSVEMNPDARSAGMANTTVAADATAFSIFDNVSAIPFSPFRFAASYGYNSGIGKDMCHSLAGYYTLSGRHSIALGLRYFDKEDIETTDDGVNYNMVKPYDAIADLGYSYAISRSLSVGANLRYISTKLDIAAESTFAADLGVYYRRNGWSAALTVANLGTQVDYGGGKESMPASVNASGSYRFIFAKKHTLNGNVQLSYRFLPGNQSYFGGGVGLEYKYNNMVAVRGGYRLGDEARSAGNYGTVGCGVYIGPVAVDFAWIFLSNVPDNVWRVSAGVRF